MSKINSYKFTSVDVLTSLLIQNNIHDGIWMFGVEFGMGGANMIDEHTNVASPVAMVSLQSIVITRVDVLSPLAIDASIANPKNKK